jgi:dihydroorotase
MTHIGRPLPLVEEVLDRLDEGDIVTHIFQGKPASSVIDDEPAFAALVAAKKRGVLFDIGHGGASFSYRVARECIARGILPDTLGSDLHTGSIGGPVWDLSLVLSKLHSIGLSLADTVAGAGSAPRRALRLPVAGLDAGAPAEFTLFTVEDADIVLPDSLGDTLTVTKRFFPRAVFWNGALSEASTRLDTPGKQGAAR